MRRNSILSVIILCATISTLLSSCVRQSELEEACIMVNQTESGFSSFLFEFENCTDVEQETSILWDFGDGTTSTDPSPSHRYSNYGKYRVTLRITEDNMERIAFQEIRIGYYEITEFYYSIEEMAPPPTSCYFSYQNGFLIAVETETDTGNAYACVSTYNEPYSGLCQSAYYDVPISTPYPKLIVTQSYSCYDPGYVNQSYQYLQFDGAEEIDLTKTLKYSDLPFTSYYDSGLVYVNISFELVTPQ